MQQTLSLFPKRRPPTQLHASLLNLREERRVKEYQKLVETMTREGM
jgi:hypothetical protein